MCVANDFGVLDGFALQHVHGRQRRRDANRIAAKGRGVRTGHPVHDLGLRHHDAKRHAAGNALCHTNDVRLDAGVLNGPPLAGAARARLDFVRHQQDAVAIANAPELLHEYRRSDHVSAFTLNGLDEDRGHFLGRQSRLEQFFFDEARAAQRKGFRFLPATHASAIHIGIAHVGHARHQRRETAALLRLGSRQ